MENEFPKRLRMLRQKRGLKRTVLSELCGLHPRAIRDYEEGVREPKLKSLLQIADFLDCSLYDLTGR